MAIRITNSITSLFLSHPLKILTPTAHNVQCIRNNKHWAPKWKQLRRLKVIKVDLPNFRHNEENMTEEEMRVKMKEKGLLPPRPWMERPFHISSTGTLIEAYVPPEGDGKMSSITAQGAKQKLEFLGKKTKTMMAIRRIRTYEEDFDTPAFCKEAQEVYMKAHELLMAEEKDDIIDYVTEKAYPEILYNVKNKTIHWKFLKNIELPRVVQARCTEVITSVNMFAQLTVRFHTQQLLAVYDRFGRLMQGSEILAKDVLEYIVFEKHISNEYGKWRIHAKIIPDWLPPREPSATTYRMVPEPEPVPDAATVETTGDVKQDKATSTTAAAAS